MLKHLAAISSGAFEVQKLGVKFFSVLWTSCVWYGKVDKAGCLSEATWTGSNWIFWPEFIDHHFMLWILVRAKEHEPFFLKFLILVMCLDLKMMTYALRLTMCRQHWCYIKCSCAKRFLFVSVCRFGTLSNKFTWAVLVNLSLCFLINNWDLLKGF